MFTRQHDYSLAPHTTFGLPARAAHYIELTDSGDLPEICRLPEFDAATVCWLGGGSNVLFMQDFPSLVVRMATRGIRELERTPDSVLLEAQAGENWHGFVQSSLHMGLGGLENLSLIPGTVGASPVQNIGAYGVEVKDRIHSVRCFDVQTQEWRELSNAECRFAYRDSIFKHEGRQRYVITSVVFRLDTQFVPNVKYGDLAQVLAEQCGSRVRHPPQQTARPGRAGQCRQFLQKSAGGCCPRANAAGAISANAALSATGWAREAGRRLVNRPMQPERQNHRRRSRARQTGFGAGEQKPRHRRRRACLVGRNLPHCRATLRGGFATRTRVATFGRVSLVSVCAGCFLPAAGVQCPHLSTIRSVMMKTVLC